MSPDRTATRTAIEIARAEQSRAWRSIHGIRQRQAEASAIARAKGWPEAAIRTQLVPKFDLEVEAVERRAKQRALSRVWAFKAALPLALQRIVRRTFGEVGYPKARPRRGRPSRGTEGLLLLDALAVFDALRERKRTWRAALDMTAQLFGVPARTLEKRCLGRPRSPLAEPPQDDTEADPPTTTREPARWEVAIWANAPLIAERQRNANRRSGFDADEYKPDIDEVLERVLASFPHEGRNFGGTPSE